MAELSPAAQAVMAAATRNTHLQTDPVYRECIAAALRALADQVAPLDTNLRQNKIRASILAIAAELEGSS